MRSFILTTGTRYIVALLLLFSIYMLLRGHNEPGGGFIGGLIGATGFVLYAVA
ncbi:MAG: MnhB domain-containing protein, partial [Pseudomonadota bacterium]